MRNLKKRIENMNLYLNSKSYSAKDEQTIRGSNSRMSSGRMTTTRDNARNTRTSDKWKTSI